MEVYEIRKFEEEISKSILTFATTFTTALIFLFQTNILFVVSDLSNFSVVGGEGDIEDEQMVFSRF